MERLFELDSINIEEFNRIFGLPYLTATFIDQANPLCDISGGALTGAGSGLAYPVIEGIPILDEDYSFYIDSSEVK